MAREREVRHWRPSGHAFGDPVDLGDRGASTSQLTAFGATDGLADRRHLGQTG